MKVVRVRNVNEALDELRTSVPNGNGWQARNSRNGPVFELDEPMATVYESPWEKVLFSRTRDANPFFHFFESLWILAGRDDVAFLALFNSRMQDYSDDGVTFHAPYGHRMRKSTGHDQIRKVVKMLRADKDTRRAVISIWDADFDLDTVSKDIPCNDMVFFKARPVRDPFYQYRLDMTVCCRSNDAIWGAYGANAVQFGTLHELVAAQTSMQPGTYTQVSDSMHVYAENPAWQKMLQGYDWHADKYALGTVQHYPLSVTSGLTSWLEQCERLCNEIQASTFIDPKSYPEQFFVDVAMPMWKTWYLYKKQNASAAIDYLSGLDTSIDWLNAAMDWLTRRML